MNETTMQCVKLSRNSEYVDLPANGERPQLILLRNCYTLLTSTDT